MPGGATSSPVMTVDPVVVMPDTDSKIASVKPMSSDDTMKGTAPASAIVSHSRLTSRKPKRVLAWGENLSLLDKREKQIAAIEAENARLTNLVALLDPNHVDPDLSTELLRRDMNVAHPDEYIIDLSRK